jgi:lipoprotein-anchoring transpeptidase ErfK/SrfK
MSRSRIAVMREARMAIKSGQLEQARSLLREAIQLNPNDHVSWIWLAGVTNSPETSLKYVQRAEALKPGDPLVIRARKWAERRMREASRPLQTPAINSPKETAGRPRWRSIAIWSGLGLALIMIGAALTLLLRSQFVNDRERVVLPQSVAVVPSATRVSALGDGAEVAEKSSPTPGTVTRAPAATPTAPRLMAKNIAPTGGDEPAAPRATWTMTPVPTDTPTPTPTYAPTFLSPQVGNPAIRPLGVGPHERWIDVNLSTQTLAAYEGNELAFSSLISSGTWEHPTVTGQFRVWIRFESQTMDGRRLGYDYYLENVPYVMYFYEDYALHGTFWHNNFGTPMSHGCVNMKTEDARWLFNWSRVGTVVNVHH